MAFGALSWGAGAFEDRDGCRDGLTHELAKHSGWEDLHL